MTDLDGLADDARYGPRPLSANDPTLPLLSVNGYRWREAVRQPGPRRWFLGAAISTAIWLGASVPSLVAAAPGTGARRLVLVNALLFLLVFAVTPPLTWGKSVPVRVAWLVLLFALTLPFLAEPAYGASGPWMWIFVVVACAMQANSRQFTLGVILVLGLASLAVELGYGASWSEALSQPAVIMSVGAMMAAFTRQLETVRELRRTQHQLAELAVAEERNRVARDMHDILGHSLTVIAVKAELAGRLLEAVPAGAATTRAALEVADLEDLARGALEDVRATVSGYRGVSVLSELANARTALAAAGIDAALPPAADTVPARYRELFGWVLREGVTNVIRHAEASRCEVTLGPGYLQIDDDGRGPAGGGGQAATGAGNATGDGNGLAGLAERARSAGAALVTGRSALGGFRLRLQL